MGSSKLAMNIKVTDYVGTVSFAVLSGLLIVVAVMGGSRGSGRNIAKPDS